MPHRTDPESEERPGRGARRQNEGDNRRANGSTAPAPGAWVRLADVVTSEPWENPSLGECFVRPERAAA